MDQTLFINFFIFSTIQQDSRLILSGEKDYLLLSSPHIPIAAVAANRLIITVINITFLLINL